MGGTLTAQAHRQARTPAPVEVRPNLTTSSGATSSVFPPLLRLRVVPKFQILVHF